MDWKKRAISKLLFFNGVLFMEQMLILRFEIEPLQKCLEVHSKVLNVCCIMSHVSAGVCVGAA